jgi:hypothetical protein
MDVNSILYTDKMDKETKVKIDELSSNNIKRVVKKIITDWYEADSASPYFIVDFQETKTTWHPVGF